MLFHPRRRDDGMPLPRRAPNLPANRARASSSSCSLQCASASALCSSPASGGIQPTEASAAQVTW
eukprot:scaffold35161_cov64-Phaeocystis_antarctica.AAC.9